MRINMKAVFNWGGSRSFWEVGSWGPINIVAVKLFNTEIYK